MSCLKPPHVQIKFITLILCFQQIDFVCVFKPNTEVLVLLRTVRNRDPFIVGYCSILSSLPRTTNWVINRHWYIAWRGSFLIAEVHIIERFKSWFLSPVRFPGFDDVLKALHIILLHFDVSQNFEGLVASDNVEMINFNYLHNKQIGLFVHPFLYLPKNVLFLRRVCEDSHSRPRRLTNGQFTSTELVFLLIFYSLLFSCRLRGRNS